MKEDVLALDPQAVVILIGTNDLEEKASRETIAANLKLIQDGVAHCLCNGELLEAAMKVPATGPIGLEGDRGQMEYRRIRIKEMP